MSILLLREEHPRARKRHTCHNCFRQIEPGETYTNQVSIGDDGLFTWKACAHCAALWHHMYEVDPELRYYDDGVDIHEWLAEKGPPATLRLFRAKWRVNGELVPIDVVTDG